MKFLFTEVLREIRMKSRLLKKIFSFGALTEIFYTFR